MERYVCIHGHFYQPPREDPWSGAVEEQPSASPYHDWNERIAAECYAPNAASLLMNGNPGHVQTVNNYCKISFNFGPTLLSWLEKQRPDVYQAILEADRASRHRFSGHGSAIAQVYNHMIMPLANKRDKQTQAVWAIRDFQKRFQRLPEGIWLPETAVDLETLEVLAALGISFTILAPHQAERVKEMGRGEWREVAGGKVDPTMAYLCPLPSGRSISVFFYHGLIALDLAFGDLLKNGELFAKRMLSAFDDRGDRPQLVHVAADGETYGHHRRYGDMALAYCLYAIESGESARLTNYGEYLKMAPPTHAVEIVENSSWSCAHGVERWRDDCGCHSGAHPEWSQAWRRPLREAMDWLRDRTAAIYEEEAAACLAEPWRARDDYIEVMLDRSPDAVKGFLRRHGRGKLTEQRRRRILRLLEMEKNALLIYSSCGWFFDDISGIEAVQVMRYAARAIELAEELCGARLEPEYVERLRAAPSNTNGNGAKVYELMVKRPRIKAVS